MENPDKAQQFVVVLTHQTLGENPADAEYIARMLQEADDAVGIGRFEVLGEIPRY